MANCINCGHTLRSYDRRCGQCGTEVPKPACKSCGIELISVYAFSCHACGTRVERETLAYQSKVGRGTRVDLNAKTESVVVEYDNVDINALGVQLASVSVDDRTDDYPFVNPSVLHKVLYVAPESAKRELRSLFYRVHRANRGDVIWVSSENALKTVQAELQKKVKRISAVCLIGTDADIPHIRWDNPVQHRMAGVEAVETDNPYGMLSTPTWSEVIFLQF